MREKPVPPPVIVVVLEKETLLVRPAMRPARLAALHWKAAQKSPAQLLGAHREQVVLRPAQVALPASRSDQLARAFFAPTRRRSDPWREQLGCE